MNDTTELSISDSPTVDIQLQESNLDWKAPGKVSADDFHKELARINKMNEKEVENVPESPQVPEMREEDESHTNDEMDEPVQAVQEEQDIDDDVDAKVIPKKRLNKEIERRKSLETELQKERDERIRYQTELDLYNKALDKMTAQEAQKEPELDPVDEQAHNLYMRKINELEKKLNEQSEVNKAGQYEKYFANAVNMQQAEFVQQQPDFDQAYKHLVDSEIATAKLLGADQAEAMQLATSKLYNLAQAALSKGQNVPEMFYKISKNYGYAGSQKNNPVKKSPNLGNIDRNMRGSASPSGEIPAVSLKPAEDIATYTSLDRFNDRFMNDHGKGVNASAFHDALRKLQGGM